MDPNGEFPKIKVVDFDVPLFYPTLEKIGITIAFVMVPLLGYFTMSIMPYPTGASGASAGTGGSWITAALLLAIVPLYLSGISQYFCHFPLITAVIALLLSYFVACYVKAKNIRYVAVGLVAYLLMLALIFKILSFFYLPPGCN
jgi:hypothetical protein